MVVIRQTDEFAKWMTRLKDRAAKARIDTRIRRMALGNFGDAKPVGDAISEARIPYGPGYRLYYIRHDSIAVVLLCGGTKATQSADIAKAKKLKKELE